MHHEAMMQSNKNQIAKFKTLRFKANERIELYTKIFNVITILTRAVKRQNRVERGKKWKCLLLPVDELGEERATGRRGFV